LAKSVYVLDDTELYGKGVADVFEATAKELGLDVKAHDGIDGKAADYRAFAAKIVAAKPDMVYYGGITQNNAGQLLKDIRAEGFTGKFMLAPMVSTNQPSSKPLVPIPKASMPPLVVFPLTSSKALPPSGIPTTKPSTTPNQKYMPCTATKLLTWQ
jgi:ABC-type branched-subunit amino acid transport system substrate-binding protein